MGDGGEKAVKAGWRIVYSFSRHRFWWGLGVKGAARDGLYEWKSVERMGVVAEGGQHHTRLWRVKGVYGEMTMS